MTPPRLLIPPRLLVTRPAEDAEPFAEALRGLGIEPILAPMVEVAFLDRPQPDLAGVQALLATSANGVRAFARLSGRRDLPVLAVGDASAREARAAGFAEVRSASGTVEDLARLAIGWAKADRGVLLHVAGSALAGDLGGLLAAAGLSYRREVLYDVYTVEALPEAAQQALREGRADGVAFFSPRTAAAFVKAVRRARLEAACGALLAFCLSAAVVARLEGIAWRGTRIAARPEQAALVTAIAEAFALG